MKQEVRDQFISFTDPIEGKCAWMYLDVLGLVTTGRGNLIDSAPAAMKLPWVRADGQIAECHEIGAEWSYVKGLRERARYGGGAFAGVTHLRLTPAAIDNLTLSKLDEMWAHLVGRFDWLEAAPWPVQLALVSMAWAMGPAFHFPHFEAACERSDWLTCAGPRGDANAFLACRGESWMRDGTPGQTAANENPGLRVRNLKNKALFEQAT
jgi:hypothetical protein